MANPTQTKPMGVKMSGLQVTFCYLGVILLTYLFLNLFYLIFYQGMFYDSRIVNPLPFGEQISRVMIFKENSFKDFLSLCLSVGSTILAIILMGGSDYRKRVYDNLELQKLGPPLLNYLFGVCIPEEKIPKEGKDNARSSRENFKEGNTRRKKVN